MVWLLVNLSGLVLFLPECVAPGVPCVHARGLHESRGSLLWLRRVMPQRLCGWLVLQHGVPWLDPQRFAIWKPWCHGVPRKLVLHLAVASLPSSFAFTPLQKELTTLSSLSRTLNVPGRRWCSYEELSVRMKTPLIGLIAMIFHWNQPVLRHTASCSIAQKTSWGDTRGNYCLLRVIRSVLFCVWRSEGGSETARTGSLRMLLPADGEQRMSPYRMRSVSGLLPTGSCVGS